MESKKINQLATNVAPVSTDLTIIGDPTTGVSKKVTLLQIANLFAGVVDFYANLAAFPATGVINTIYCAKDTQKLYLWSGSAYVETFPSQAVLNTYQLLSAKGVANGYASLDSGGKVPIAQLPSSIMEYKGLWSAATNTPTLADGTGDTGDVYICSAAGTVNFGAGAITFAVGDYVIYSGTIWQRSSGAVGTVTSVGITETGDALSITGSPITTSGTINIGFAGSAAQYVAGDGSLVTFPTLLASDSLVKLVRNQSGATMTAGTVVYISGATGNKPLISKALATGDATSAQTYGLLQTDIANNADGYIVVIGNVTSLDTSALTEGQQLYLSGTTAGTYTTTKPYAPIHLVYVGIVLRAHPTMGIIGVKIQNGYEMDELHNVDAYLPNNNDILSYNTTTSLWEHKQIATTLGYTPANDSLVVHLAGTETITGVKTFTNSNIFSGNNLFTTYPNRFNEGIGIKETASYGTISGYTIIAGATNGLSLYLASGGIKTFAFTSGTSNNTFTFPNATGTVALTSDLTGGTVTSAALSAPTGFSVTGSPVTTTGTLALSFAAGYSLPTNASQTNWDSAYTNRITSLTTTGNSGSATLVSNTLNVPTYTLAGLGGISLTSLSATTPLSYNNTTGAFSIQVANTSQDGYLSSTDWNTFNSKQSTITNPVTGTGTSGQVTYFNGTSSVTSSSSFKFDGTNLTIGNPSSALAQLHVFNSSAAASFLLQTNSTTDYSEIAVRNNSSTATSYFRQYSTATTLSDFGVSRAGLALFFSNYATNFVVGTRNGGDLIFGTNDTERVRILSSNGYVGIGPSMTSPSYQLDVNGTGRFTGNVTVGSGSGLSQLTVGNGAGYTGVVLSNGSTIYSWLLGSQYNINNGFEITPSTAVGGSTFTTPVFKILNTGAATFSSSVQANANFISNTTTDTPSVGTSAANNATYNYLGYSGYWGLRTTTTGNNFALDTYNGGTPKNVLTITQGGNVGIGTSSPSNTLDVVKAASHAIRVQNTANTSDAYFIAQNTAGAAFFGINATGPYIYTAAALDLTFAPGNTEKMRITSGGNVGINTTTIGYKLTVNGDIASDGAGAALFVEARDQSLRYAFYANDNVSLFFYSTVGGNVGNFNRTTGIYTPTSDINKKKDFEDSTIGLNAILGLKPTLYRMKLDDDNSPKHLGFIAQQVKDFIPQAYVESDDMIGLSDRPIIAALVKAIQEQQKQIEELKLKIK